MVVGVTIALALSACTGGNPTSGAVTPTSSTATEASGSAGSGTDSCQQGRSMPGRPSATDLVVGPLSYGGLLAFADRSDAPGEAGHGDYFYKSGAQLKPGAVATVAIASQASTYAGLVTETGPESGFRQVTFHSCPGGEFGTWWVGGFVLRGRRTACLPIDITTGSSITTKRVVVSLGGGSCS
jgi:hypothetical protein